MDRIPIETLREMWQQEGVDGEWRRLLRQGYDPEELYFEFGLMPEKQRGCHYRIILEHKVPVWLCPQQSPFAGLYVIRPRNECAGEIEIKASKENNRIHYQTFFVTEPAFTTMLDDAARIFSLYQNEESVCFWSIPNKWFAELALIQFITQNIVLKADFRAHLHGRRSWYWP